MERTQSSDGLDDGSVEATFCLFLHFVIHSTNQSGTNTSAALKFKRFLIYIYTNGRVTTAYSQIVQTKKEARWKLRRQLFS